MKIIKYNKLIRDGIPKIIKEDGGAPKISRLPKPKFLKELRKKLIEESREIQKAEGGDSLVNELSDVLEVLMAIAGAERISWPKVERKRKEKKKKRGGFARRLFLKEARRR